MSGVGQVERRHGARERLLGIQFGRGLAALLVAIYHSCRMMELPQYAGHKGFAGIFEFGHAGVDFFFVLSGFIIYFVHHRDLGQPQSLLRYSWRRVCRIYPNYWLVLAVVVAMAIRRDDGSFTVHHFIKSLFLLPDVQEPMLGVAWTLVHEMMFYTVFALGIFNLRFGIIAGLVWFGLVLAGTAGLSMPVYPVVTSVLNLQFLMGIAAAAVVMRARISYALWLAGAGVVVFLATGVAENAGLLEWAGAPGHMIFGASAAVVIVGIATAEQQGSLRVGRIGELFGGASYLLYLVHPVVIGFALQGLKAAGLVKRLPDVVMVPTLVALAVSAAFLLYRYFDLPVQSALNRFGRERVFASTRA